MQLIARPDVWDYWLAQFVTGTVSDGTSGAPWLDETGDVIGVQLGRTSASHLTTHESVGFMATPEDIEDLLKHRDTRPLPSLGAQFAVDVLAPSSERKINTHSYAISIASEDHNSPLERAGIPLGSWIIGTPINSMQSIDTLIIEVRHHKPGDTMAVDVMFPNDVSARRIVVTLDAVSGDERCIRFRR
jgi:S1-C subfamily serine protease